MIVLLRLAFGTFVVLLPGAAVARALGRRSASSTLAWTMAAVFVAWAVVFTVHAGIRLAALVLLAILAAAVVSARARTRDPDAEQEPGLGAWPWLVGAVLGLALWHVEGAVVGDAPFHEARIRKLVDLGNLHLRTVDEFRDGGLHPGYAFPLWHGFLALVSWVSGLDPATVLRHEPTLLAVLACVVAWEAGAVLFGSRWAGLSVLLALLALFCFAPGHGGSFATLALPGTAARQLLAPAAVALFFSARGAPGWASVAAIFGGLVLTHPTYALFLLLPVAAYAAFRLREWREWAPALAGAIVPTVLALLWLRPIVAETRSHTPNALERTRAVAHYAPDLVIANDRHYRLAPQVFDRSGAIAVAALVLLPLTAVGLRRRWGAFAFGGTLLLLLLLEVPWLFVHFSDVVSLSQSRRAAGFAPLPFVVAGAAALLARRALVLPLALAAGVAAQLLWPGDFASPLTHGGPAAATWIALVGGLAALAVVLAWRPREVLERHRLGAAVTACFVLPVAVHGFLHWSARTPTDPDALPPRLVHELRTRVPARSVVIAPLQVSYRAVAAAPIYIVAIPVAHVANTKANSPGIRAKAVRRWLKTNDPRIPARYGATWAIRGGRLYRLRP